METSDISSSGREDRSYINLPIEPGTDASNNSLSHVYRHRRLTARSLSKNSVISRDDAALRWASFFGRIKVARLAIEKGADIHIEDDYPLRRASRNGYVDIVRLLLENGANVHAQSDEALLMASQNGHVEVVRLLLDNGADVHAENDDSVMWAMENGHIDVVHLLIEKDADVHVADDFLLSEASKNGHTDLVRLLLKKGANVNARSDAALRLASEKGHVDVVRLLIENGADVHAQDDYALRLASEKGHVDVVRLLIDNGANVHADTDAPLRWASQKGHVEVVRFLIQKGANVHALSDDALREASKNGHLNVVRLLIDNGANVHAENDDALRRASSKGHVEVVRLLIQKGAYVYENIVNIATENGQEEIVALLRDQEVFPDPIVDSDEDDSDEDIGNVNENLYIGNAIENAYYSLFYNQLDDIDIPQSKLDLLLSTEMDEPRDLEMVNYLYNRGAVAKITPNYIKTAGRVFPTDELKWRIVMFFVAKGFLPATTDLLAAASNGDADKVAEIITMREFIPQEIIDAYLRVRDSQANLPRLVPFDRALAKKGPQYGDLMNPSIIMAYALASAHGQEEVVQTIQSYMENKYIDTLPYMTFYLNSIPKLPDIPVLERIIKLNPSIVDTVVTRAIQTDNLDAVKKFGEEFTKIAKEAIVAKKMSILTYAMKNISYDWMYSGIMETVIETKNVDALDVVYRFSSFRLNQKQFTDIAVKDLSTFIHYLVENGLTQKYKDEALFLASRKGDTKLVEYLVKRGADPSAERARAFRVAANEGIQNILKKRPSFSLVHRPTEDVDSVFMIPLDPSIAYRMCVNGHSWLYDPVNEVHVCPLCRAGAQSELFVNAESGPPVIYTPDPNPGLIKEKTPYTQDLPYGPIRKLALGNTRRPVYDTEVQEITDYPYDNYNDDINNYSDREQRRRQRDAERLIRRQPAQRRE